jgi:phytoene synthase
MSLTEDLGYCAGELRRHDHDRYLVTLLAREEAKGPLTALYAFNLELARTSESVSEAMLGRIRLQWWRESLEGIYEARARRHAVVQPLAAAILAYDLPRASLEALIDRREADLESEPFATREDLLNYAEVTGGGLEETAMRLVSPEESEARALARLTGRAWALTGVMRALPFFAAQGRLMLPRGEAKAAGLSLQRLPAKQDALKELVESYAALAEQDLAEARRAGRFLSRAAKRQLSLARIADLHLGRLRAAGFDPFEPRVSQAPPNRAWRLLTGRLLNRF